uniref:Zinc transporter ZIP9 n=1 Tax=Astyanax mexicanus TaxID=7994 RepID=A0A3B1J059_ASTMX
KSRISFLSLHTITQCVSCYNYTNITVGVGFLCIPPWHIFVGTLNSSVCISTKNEADKLFSGWCCMVTLADGVALGAAVASSQASVQVIVFFAVILHKAPAAFGLVSFLMHAGLEKSTIQKHLLAFSAAAPVLAISTYFILSTHRLSATGIGMLVSAGTFLYVATVHVLPEVNSRGQQRTSHFHHHAGPGPYQQRGLSVPESITLITGAALPVLLALGLPDD